MASSRHEGDGAGADFVGITDLERLRLMCDQLAVERAEVDVRVAIARRDASMAELARRYHLGPEDRIDGETGAITRVSQWPRVA